MTARKRSASSICGEWPLRSNTTSSAFGISEAIVSADDGGVTQSVRPTVTSVGAVTCGSAGRRSYAGMLWTKHQLCASWR